MVYKNAGQLSYENSWLKNNLENSNSRQERLAMIDRSDKKLSISKQADLLSLNRTGIYYKAVPASQEEYHIKWLIDEIYTEHPEYGYRTMTMILNRDHKIKINKKRTRKYMREMGIHGICPGPNLSKKAKAAYIYPYLLRRMNIVRPNCNWQVVLEKKLQVILPNFLQSIFRTVIVGFPT